MSAKPPSFNASPGLFWLFASPFGRVSREAYWLGLLLVWMIIGLAVNMWLGSLPVTEELTVLDLSQFMSSNPLFPVLFLVLQWVDLALVIKRCQDVGLPGFFAVLIFVPVLNIITVLVLGFMPSQKSPNRYGPFANSYYQGKR